MFVRRSSVSIAALVLGVALVAHADGPAVAQARHDALLMKQKVAAITAYAEPPVAQTAADDGDREGSERLPGAASSAANCRPASSSPSISILGTGRLSGRAVVDLDAVRQAEAARRACSIR